MVPLAIGEDRRRHSERFELCGIREIESKGSASASDIDGITRGVVLFPDEIHVRGAADFKPRGNREISRANIERSIARNIHIAAIKGHCIADLAGHGGGSILQRPIVAIPGYI